MMSSGDSRIVAPAPAPAPAPGLLLLGPEHLQDCLALDQASLQGLWTPAQWQRELEEPGRPGIGLWQEGALRAMACGWRVVDELHITLVAVCPAHRRLGLGRQVLEALLEQARADGAHHATLEVAVTNPAARALYAAVGFADAGLRRGYYRNGDDALIQWMNLKTSKRFG